ncbi:MAG: uroporphyrinogen decarboxylase family protein [Candidatus Hodarchaeota archaeon]
MKARDRFIAVFEHRTQDLDRIPIFMGGAPPMGLFYQAWIEEVATEDLPDEFIKIIPGLGDRTMQTWLGGEVAGVSIPRICNYPGVVLEPGDKHYNPEARRTVDTAGRMMESSTMHGVGYSWHVGPYFDTWEAREAFLAKHGEFWDDKYAPGEVHVKNFKDQWNAIEKDGSFFPMGGAWIIWEAIFEGVGPSAFARMARKEPKKLDTIIEQNAKPVLRSMAMQLETGLVDVVSFPDDLGQKDRPLLSVNHYDRFIKPVLKQYADLCHKHGAKLMMHSCGFIEPLIPSFIDAGLDALQALEATANNNHERIRKAVKDRLILVGGMDSSLVLTFGTPEDVVNEVKKKYRDMIHSPEDTCYIAGPTHAILDCPVKNVETFRDAIIKYGTYKDGKPLALH